MKWKWIFGIIALQVLSGCDQKKTTSTTDAAKGKLDLVVVNYPLKYFAERIGGDQVEVQFLAPGDTDPAYWTPDDETVTAFQQADMILLNGAGYAQWFNKVTLPPSKLINTTFSVQDKYIEMSEQATHTHGPEGKHAHSELAFTTWLDPGLAIAQADAIRKALSKELPGKSGYFNARFLSLAGDLQKIDSAIVALTTQVQDEPLIFSHPIYQYFEKHYALHGKSVHWEPNQFPDRVMLKDLEEILIEHPAEWMVWESEPLTQTIDKLKEYGIGIIVFDPSGNTPVKGDYISVMEQNIHNLQMAFSTQ
ncbi:MAG: metal ABC transporter substrate-binding protein [Bacteroidales bacterium]|nr:metal ABC transporter substrate-binding protein [Bacteroidales bacterium]